MKGASVDKKYLTIKEAMEKYPLCRTTLAYHAEKADAVRHIGRRVLINSAVFDEYIEKQDECLRDVNGLVKEKRERREKRDE